MTISIADAVTRILSQPPVPVHADLQGDFVAAGLKYFTSLRAAMNQLQAGGEIP